MLLNDYEQHQRRLIQHYSRRSTSLSELQGRLKERGIKMKFTEGKNQKIVFATQRNFRIDSKFANDRVFTNMATKNVDRNAKLQKVKEVEIKPKGEQSQYAKFEQMKEKRQEALITASKDRIRDKYTEIKR